MSEKHLTEQPWKVLAAKNQIKDNGFQKALSAYDKIDVTKDPARASDCLADIFELAGKLKKANPAVKEIVSYLDEVIKEVGRAKQAIAALPKPMAKEEHKEEEQNETEEESADLKVRLINSLKKVKTTDPTTPIGFVACVAKPVYGLLFSKSPSERIGATHKKTLTDLTGGTKFVVGTCVFENEAYTFVVESVPSGLAKNIKKALKEFTGNAYKVRVRDVEGKVVADGETEVADDETAEPTPATSAPPAPPPADPRAEEMARFTARLKGLQPEILKAISAKSPQGEEIKKKAAEAGALAGKNDFGNAHSSLDSLEALLKQAPPVAAAPPAAPPAPAPSATREIKLSTYLNGRANLRAARESAAKELTRLQQVILAKAAGEPFFKDVEEKSKKLFDFLTPINEEVTNKLDEAGKCADPELQLELNKKVRELIQKQLNGIRNHPLAAFVEKNPFGKFAIKQPLEVTLSALDKQLS